MLGVKQRYTPAPLLPPWSCYLSLHRTFTPLTYFNKTGFPFSANNMVEQTRQPSCVVSPQAGPGEVGADALFDVNLRINDRAARAFGSRLAEIGDQLQREWTSRRPNRLPTPLHMLRPAQALTGTIYRDIHRQLWGIQRLPAAVTAWVSSATPGTGVLRANAWAAWVFSLKPVTCAGWTRGALVAAVTVFGALWVEWKA
ncbi:bcl-2-interacting killer isoform 1-T1 [Spinachia spinachia]